MTQRTCPHCGEYVEQNSLTCPKCFREVPREPPAVTQERASENEKRTSGKVPGAAVFLAIFPAFIGLLGLGIIYTNPKNRNGYLFLFTGLVLFLPFVALFFLMLGSGLLSAILLFVATIIFLLLYIFVAIVAFIETTLGSVFRILRF